MSAVAALGRRWTRAAPCNALTCTHPRTATPDVFLHLAELVAVRAHGYADRTPRERRALERARRENPGRASELRRLETVQRWMRRADRGAA